MSTDGRMGVDRLREHANERDLAVLHSVRSFKFLSTRHIYELHFARHASYVSGIRACTRVLTRLESHRFITRLPRPVGGTGGGSTSTIWSIGPAGDRLLRSIEPTDRPRTRSYEPTLTFLKHTLAIADLRIVLERHVRTNLLELLEVHTEPNNWRKFVNRTGQLVTLKPDLTTVTAIGNEELFHYWEVDLGTEHIVRLIEKSRTYQQYYDTGTEQQATGVFPQVVWLLGEPRRRQKLQEALSADPTLRADLFVISTHDSISNAVIVPPEQSPTGAVMEA